MRTRPKQKLKTSPQARRRFALAACAAEEKNGIWTSRGPNQLPPYNKSIEPTARGLSRSLRSASTAPGSLRGSPCRPTAPAVLAVHRCVIRTIGREVGPKAMVKKLRAQGAEVKQESKFKPGLHHSRSRDF